MTGQRKDLELEDERTAQKRYAKILQEKARQPIPHQRPRNNIWTGTALPPPQQIPDGQLAGRVALVGPAEDLEGQADFYIGERHADLDGISVYSWAAPVACTMYRGKMHHQLCDQVAVVRSFSHRRGEIVDFDDETVRADAPAEPFRRRSLVVLPAPSPVTLPRPALPTDSPAIALAPGTDNDRPGSGASGQLRVNQRQRSSTEPVRAAALLRTQMQAPRTRSLAPVLSTLQPDQYELVTAPPAASMTIEGHPGTGKTIVAAHRAAYLVLPEEDAERPHDKTRGDVLLVGPTPGYTLHVRDIVHRLTARSPRVHVRSLPELLLSLVRLRSDPPGNAPGTWRDADEQLARFASLARTRLEKNSGKTPMPDQVYELLRSNGTASATITRDDEWRDYMQSLPPYRQALQTRALLPLLAFINWDTARPGGLRSIGHIIVDEAQDVTSLEWHLLDTMNRSHTWTILGDMNQRRSPYSLLSWAAVEDLLGDIGLPPQRLRRGYRSTKPILEYANQLLPRGERAILAFQEDGRQPFIEKVKAAELGRTVLSHVSRVLAADPARTVAVIGYQLQPVRYALRFAGWATTGNGQQWEIGERTVAVLEPDAARGLEFDSVIVTEPADFAQDLEHRGSLYTALTRANRELFVVHSRPLPDALRRR